jgi:aerobic-type carbon monoxide dehydrogenase small subunit (CoxS/CutS family)
MMSLVELLSENPDPSDDEIKDVLGGQICRCTGYQSILKSVHSAIAKLRTAGLAAQPPLA